MASIDDFFTGATDEPAQPRLRDWRKRINDGASAHLELYRPTVDLGLAPTKMIVHFAGNGSPEPPEELDWDEQLNRGLLQLKVRACDPAQEAQRFALDLRDGFRPVEKEFGNGFFNTVLLDLTVDSQLDRYPEIAEVLQFTYHDRTERKSQDYQKCREAIALGIGARAKELTTLLGYTQDEAKTILAQALAKYLDERFSVSSRRQLGLLS